LILCVIVIPALAGIQKSQSVAYMLTYRAFQSPKSDP
jgi:hypothetical protein